MKGQAQFGYSALTFFFCFLSSEHICLPAYLLYGINRLRDWMQNAEGREWMESFIQTHTHTLSLSLYPSCPVLYVFGSALLTEKERMMLCVVGNHIDTSVSNKTSRCTLAFLFFFFLHHCEKKTGNKATELLFFLFSTHSLLPVVFFVNQHTQILCLFWCSAVSSLRSENIHDSC